MSVAEGNIIQCKLLPIGCKGKGKSLKRKGMQKEKKKEEDGNIRKGR